MPAKRGSSLALLAVFLVGCSPLQPIDIPPEDTPPPAHNALWDTVATSAGHDWHALLNDGPSALDWRLRAIDSASDSIDFQTFLWHFDTAGAMVLDHVLRAADRGVDVRILIDDTFLVHEDEVLLAIAEHPRIEYRVFNPFKYRSGGLVARELGNVVDLRRLDHRMHNKAMVVDNQIAIVGGRNIGDAYFGLDDTANFRDLELILGGTMVQEISDRFDQYWNDHWSFPIEMISHSKASAQQLAEARRVSAASLHVHEEESTDVRLGLWLDLVETADIGKTVLFVDNPHFGDSENSDEAPTQVANALTDMFNKAESEIVIVSAYLIPTPDLEGAVARALDRGVRVRILTNSINSNNHLAAHSAYTRHIDTLLDNGAELHEVRIDAENRDRYMLTPVARKQLALHAKALIIDHDKVFIGSANLDPRSLRINTEMGLLVLSESFNASVRAAVEGDFSGANAWRLEMQPDGRIFWLSEDKMLESQPATSFMQRIEDWFLSTLPIEDKL